MSGRMAKNKGANGEREMAKVLTGWSLPVCEYLGVPVPEFERTASAQSKGGGYDLCGVPWLAVEVKRVETMALPAWWRQCKGQARPGQIPFLAWRQNRKPWQFRVLLKHSTGAGSVLLAVDMDYDNARSWYQYELYARLIEEDQT